MPKNIDYVLYMLCLYHIPLYSTVYQWRKCFSLVHVLGSTPITLQPVGIVPAKEGSMIHPNRFAIVLNLLYIVSFKYIVL